MPTLVADVAGDYVFSLVVGDGRASSTAAKVVVDVADPLSPSAPAGVKIVNEGSLFVSLSWDFSSGGAGGVDLYKIYRDGTQVGQVSGVLSSWNDFSVLPNKKYSYSVRSVAISGALSHSSAQVAAQTQGLDVLASKFMPYILFATSSGKIWSQFYASEKVISSATLPSGYSLIQHAPIDKAFFGIRAADANNFYIYSYASDLNIEPIIPSVTVGGLGSGSVTVKSVNLQTGSSIGQFSGSFDTAFLLNMSDGSGNYLSNEIF